MDRRTNRALEIVLLRNAGAKQLVVNNTKLKTERQKMSQIASQTEYFQKTADWVLHSMGKPTVAEKLRDIEKEEKILTLRTRRLLLKGD